MIPPWPIDELRDCCEGAVPGVVATCSDEGIPNVAYLSQIEYLDAQHVALSFQFFNTTRRNILANPVAKLLLIHPQTAAMYRLDLRYLRTEISGPLFERMRAKLAGIASHEGMSGIFRLQGSDIYRITDFEAVPGKPLPRPAARRHKLSAMRRSSDRLAAVTELDVLFETLLVSLQEEFGIDYSQVLLLDESGRKLYAVATRGYGQASLGFEIPLGSGVVGTAAASRTAIRIGHMTSEYAYGRAIRDAAIASGLSDQLETEIPLAGIANPRSQLAVPILAPAAAQGRLLGVLYVESEQNQSFGYDDEDALTSLAHQLAMTMQLLQASEVNALDDGPPVINDPELELELERAGPALLVRHFAENHSVFLDQDYLIKGVAGAILWTLLCDYQEQGRTSFSNRELRLDPRIGLPELGDNLEARLLLLQRRLGEREAGLRIEKTGRGRFHLGVDRPVRLLSG